MDYKSMIETCGEYYDFTMTVYQLTKSTILGPDIDIPFIISAEDAYPLLGHNTGFAVTIHLFSILGIDGLSDNQIKNIILELVVHELHHTTQNLDTHKYATDSKYHNDIECSCNWMTWDYLNKFKDILEEFLKLTIDFEFLSKYQFNPIYRADYLRYKKYDANSWANLINSLVATTSDSGVYPNMEKEINDRPNCALRLVNKETEECSIIIYIKGDGEYFIPDYDVRKALHDIATPNGTIQCMCEYNDIITVFTILYTLSDGDNQSLYSPLIRLKEGN